MGFFWWILIMVVAYFSFANLGLYIAFLLPLFGYIYMQWEEQQVNLSTFIRLKRLQKNQAKLVQQLIAQRTKIVAY
jgi:uncharacterized protein (DUF58 family)